MGTEGYFQDFLPGKGCFGCGSANEHGLRIRSYWDGDTAKCEWQPEAFHVGWSNLTCGGIIATVVDCHCIATAMATAYRSESRALDSEPRYVFATGSMSIRYLKPAPVVRPLELRARVTDIGNGRKYTVACDVFVEQEKTAEAEVIVLLVYRSDRPEDAPEAFRL